MNLTLDPVLLAEAVALGRHTTEAEAIGAALAEYVRSRRQQEFLALMGTVDWDDDYDYKANRMRDLKRIPTDDDDC